MTKANDTTLSLELKRIYIIIWELAACSRHPQSPNYLFLLIKFWELTRPVLLRSGSSYGRSRVVRDARRCWRSWTWSCERVSSVPRSSKKSPGVLRPPEPGTAASRRSRSLCSPWSYPTLPCSGMILSPTLVVQHFFIIEFYE